MPLGVPKVAYAPSNDKNAEWIDLYNRLLRDGMLFLCIMVSLVKFIFDAAFTKRESIPKRPQAFVKDSLQS